MYFLLDFSFGAVFASAVADYVLARLQMASGMFFAACNYLFRSPGGVVGFPT
jgi:hypothetical protein